MDGMVHRRSNNIYSMVFGALRIGALDGVYSLLDIVFDGDDGRYLAWRCRGVGNVYLMRYAPIFVDTFPLPKKYNFVQETTACHK